MSFFHCILSVFCSSSNSSVVYTYLLIIHVNILEYDHSQTFMLNIVQDINKTMQQNVRFSVFHKKRII